MNSQQNDININLLNTVMAENKVDNTTSCETNTETIDIAEKKKTYMKQYRENNKDKWEQPKKIVEDGFLQLNNKNKTE